MKTNCLVCYLSRAVIPFSVAEAASSNSNLSFTPSAHTASRGRESTENVLPIRAISAAIEGDGMRHSQYIVHTAEVMAALAIGIAFWWTVLPNERALVSRVEWVDVHTAASTTRSSLIIFCDDILSNYEPSTKYCPPR
jgi:hypothetical protein